jgi:adenylate cyclase
MSFFAELKRRNVYKVAVAYAVVGWLLVQVATQVFPFLEIPNCVVRVVIALVVIGFPIALVIVWAFEATPEGIKQTETADGMPAAAGEKKHAWIYIVVTGAAISVALFLFGRYTAGNKTVAAAPNESQTKLIAALPFVNMSVDKNDEYLSAGVSEELITALSKITGLQVKARTSSFAFKGKNEDIPKIGELKEGRRALEIDPPSVTARWYSAGHFSTPAGAKKRLSKCPKRWNSIGPAPGREHSSNEPT